MFCMFLSLRFVSFLLMDDVTFHELSRHSYGTPHSILIYLFIKLELNNFLPPPLPKYCFCSRVVSCLQEGF